MKPSFYRIGRLRGFLRVAGLRGLPAASLANLHLLPALVLLVFALTGAAAGQNDSPARGGGKARAITAVVLESWPPQYLLDQRGKPAGFAIDVMNEVAKIAGLTVTYKVRPNFPTALQALRRGEADVVPNMGIIPQRRGDLAFTDPVETFEVCLFVRDTTKEIKSVADLAGRNVAVVKTNIGTFLLRDRTDIKLHVYPDVRSAVFQLLSGQVDALVYPKPVVFKILGEIGLEDRVQVVGKPLREVRRGIAVRKDDTELLAILNAAVAQFIKTHAYQAVYAKWYGKPRPFWTARRIAWAMSAVLVAVLVLMALWRYRTMVRLNHRLKKAAEEISEKSGLLEKTLENMGHGFCVFDADSRLLAFNHKFVDLFGFRPGFIHVGMHHGELLRDLAEKGLLSEKAGDIDDMVERRVASARRGVARSNEGEAPDGRHFVYARLPLPDGGFVITYTDISDRRRAEREAAEKSLLLEATFQNMSQGVAVFNTEQRLVAYNEKYELFGNKPKGFLRIGMAREEILWQRVEAGVVKAREVPDRVRGPQSRKRFTREQHHPDGRIFFYERTPLPGGGLIATYTDITDLKAAEERVRQAQKMEAIGQLTGGIAHDFNNLLAVSIGNVELAQEKAQGFDVIQPFLSTIKRANERGAALTSKLLAFSRTQTLFPLAIDAGELVSNMSELLCSALGETIKVDITTADGLWSCHVDPHQLESAILNLAINSRDAMPGGGELALRAQNVRLDENSVASGADVPAGEYVLVSVRDTGTGMPKDVQDHAFDPFFTTKEVGHGTGLGLSMVYGFVKQSQGHVTVYSEEGKGTEIRLYLPRCHDAVRAKEVEHDDGEEIPVGFGESVLVVEDDPDVRALVVELISGFGYGVLEAADGESALEILDSAPEVRLVFTDVVLPGAMAGPDLAAEVRSRFPGIATLFTSGYSDLTKFDLSVLGGDTILLQKPYRKAELARRIRLALEKAVA